VDPELQALLSVFVEEARERLERLTGLLGRLATEPVASSEAKRELHTLKGAGRMMQLGEFAELCHAAEEALLGGGAAAAPVLLRACDRLSAMTEVVARGGALESDPELLAELAASAKSGTRETAPATPPPAPPPAPAPATTAPAAAPAPPEPAPSLVPRLAELRVDATALDAVSERAMQVRVVALATHRSVERLQELATLAEEGMREPQPVQVLAMLASMLRRAAGEIEGSQRRLLRAGEEQLETILALQMQPLRGPLLSLARHARDLARTLARRVEVTIAGEETQLDRRVVRELEGALLHLVRNAVDHGIEPPAARAAAGKDEVGQLELTAEPAGERVRLRIRDDGGGIDPRRVARRAAQLGWLDEATAATLSREDALRLLFRPGFSTRESASEISGRGIGLDAVAAAIERVGGTLEVRSEVGQSTSFLLDLPVARRGELLLLLRVGNQRLALPAASLARVSALLSTAVVERDGRLLARIGERLVPFVSLPRLLGQPLASRTLLLEGFSAGVAFALAVDGIEGEEETLLRPPPRRVALPPWLEGLAVLSSGEPIAVLSPAALEREDVRRPAAVVPVAGLRGAARILLVDDSRVTREMERRLLEDAGFLVVVAADGAEALECLGAQEFDCVVTDIEMPGLDGFELTGRLRSSERFAHLPIVVVSTRDRPEDRLRGLQAGADAYLTKQSLVAAELVDVVRRLSGR